MGDSIMDDVNWKRISILYESESGYSWAILVPPEVYRDDIISGALYIVGVNSIPYSRNVGSGEAIGFVYTMRGCIYVYILDDYIHGKYSSTEYDHVITSVSQLMVLIYPPITEESKEEKKDV